MKMYEKLNLWNGKVQGSMFAVDNVNSFIEKRKKVLAEQGIEVKTVRLLNTPVKDAMPIEVFSLCDNLPITEFPLKEKIYKDFPRYIAFYR